MHRTKNPFRIPDRLPTHFSSKTFIDDLIRTVQAQEPSFKRDYLLSEILSKYVDPTTTPANVRADSAIQKWLQAERRNEQTNQRLLIGDVDFGWIEYDRLLKTIRSIIARVLGPLVYPDVLMQGVHTNGASTRVRRSPTSATLKLTGECHISSSAVKHWLAAFTGSRLSSQTLQLREESDLFTVPKNSDIDRVACKEPEGNMLLQRSVGIYIRQRLKRVAGIDLLDQTNNQLLAQRAVRDGLATIDLSSASDTISRQLVISLLPFDWWSLLDDLRVKHTLIDGESHELEMFSSMGNGFTFELESLLFYAITRAVCWKSGCKGRISVYGDDIIAPSRVVPRLMRVMNFLGFKVNPKKTHYSGMFRESCGRHYHGGFDVTPFYIRKEVVTYPELINHLNHILEWDGRGWGFFTSEEAYRFWLRYIKLIPKFLWGGIDAGDPTALVTGHSPRRRLAYKTRPLGHPREGAYLLWFLLRQHSDLPVAVDPRLQGKAYAKPVISRGERTTWDPGAIWRT